MLTREEMKDSIFKNMYLFIITVTCLLVVAATVVIVASMGSKVPSQYGTPGCVCPCICSEIGCQCVCSSPPDNGHRIGSVHLHKRSDASLHKMLYRLHARNNSVALSI